MKRELVRNWMTPNPIKISIEASLTDAHDLLKEYNIRRLPVVNKRGHLVGIVTLGDIREASPSDATSLSIWEVHYLLAKLKIREIMTLDPITIYTTDTIADAANVMLEYKISGLPVVEPDGRLVGIITESDIFRLVVQAWGEANIEAEPTPEEILVNVP
jgi:CBS domain-containing protein